MSKTVVPPGTLVEITATMNRLGYYGNPRLSKGDRFIVAADNHQPGDCNGFTWLQDKEHRDFRDGTHYGWCKFKVIAPKPAISGAQFLELFTHLAKLGPRALVVLTAIAARLAKGAEEHGDFPNLDRDWTQEAAEEDLDGIVYRTVDLMRRTGKL